MNKAIKICSYCIIILAVSFSALWVCFYPKVVAVDFSTLTFKEKMAVLFEKNSDGDIIDESTTEEDLTGFIKEERIKDNDNTESFVIPKVIDFDETIGKKTDEETDTSISEELSEDDEEAIDKVVPKENDYLIGDALQEEKDSESKGVLPEEDDDSEESDEDDEE